MRSDSEHGYNLLRDALMVMLIRERLLEKWMELILKMSYGCVACSWIAMDVGCMSKVQ